MKFWQEQENWDRLSAWHPGADPQDETLQLLYEQVKSVQLPSYLYLYGSRSDARLLQEAALVRLASECEEHPLLGADCEDDLRRQVLDERIPALLHFLLLHMIRSERFLPHPDRHCDWCAFRNGCENGV